MTRAGAGGEVDEPAAAAVVWALVACPTLCLGDSVIGAAIDEEETAASLTVGGNSSTEQTCDEKH